MSINPFDRTAGETVTLTPADPGAGVALTMAVPTDTIIQVISVDFTLATSAVAGNRLVQVQGSDGTDVFNTSASPAAQPAGGTIDYHFAVGAVELNAIAICADIYAPLAEHLILRPGNSLRIITENWDAGDALTDIVVRALQWIVS